MVANLNSARIRSRPTAFHQGGFPEPSVWLIKTAQTIPDSELWLHEPEAAAQLDRAMAAMDQPPEATDLDTLELHLSSR